MAECLHAFVCLLPIVQAWRHSMEGNVWRRDEFWRRPLRARGVGEVRFHMAIDCRSITLISAELLECVLVRNSHLWDTGMAIPSRTLKPTLFQSVFDPHCLVLAKPFQARRRRGEEKG